MNASRTETENCPRCHGTGSGPYNAGPSKSTCEICDGTGLAVPARIPAATAVLGEPQS